MQVFKDAASIQVQGAQIACDTSKTPSSNLLNTSDAGATLNAFFSRVNTRMLNEGFSKIRFFEREAQANLQLQQAQASPPKSPRNG